MNQGILLRAPTSGWASSVFGDLLPGGHAAVFGGFRIPLEAEDAGLVVRDCLLVLGPVVHRVWLLRKPCTEATVAAQVLATGTGAMWIDGCRVYTDWNEADRPDSWKRAGFTAKPGAEKIAAPPGQGINCHPLGRWPTNVLFVHLPGCQREGSRKVKGGNDPRRRDGTLNHGEFWGKNRSTVHTSGHSGFGDGEGFETVPAWSCTEGCPIWALDQQSGETTNTRHMSYKRSGEGFIGSLPDKPESRWWVQETGYASRFFPQFTSEDDLDQWLLRLILGPPT